MSRTKDSIITPRTSQFTEISDELAIGCAIESSSETLVILCGVVTQTTCLLIYLFTPCSRVLLEQLTGFRLVKKFSACYGTRSFITAFTGAYQLSLSSTSSIQFIPPHPTAWRSILILSFHLSLGLPSGLFPLGFPIKTLYTLLFSPIGATCLAHLILLAFITRTVLGEYSVANYERRRQEFKFYICTSLEFTVALQRITEEQDLV